MEEHAMKAEDQAPRTEEALNAKANQLRTVKPDTEVSGVDTLRVEEHDLSKANPGTVRQAIEKEMRVIEGPENWRCVAVTKDPRNVTRVRVTFRTRWRDGTCERGGSERRCGQRPSAAEQLSLVKVYKAMLEENGELRMEVVEMLKTENDVEDCQAGLAKQERHGRSVRIDGGVCHQWQ
ncbi:hypothetical protein LTR17_024869 [Elasticomyces elasticus]|nr:hypothetical protein LTR17_024869 [Elasticomyces elasticus]